jgi:hypothetical protein
MPARIDGLQGRREQLADHFDTFLFEDDLFAVGIDISAPGFSGGSVTLMSGDDEYFRSVTEPFPAEHMPGIAATAEVALARLDSIAPARQGRDARRRVPSRFAGGTLSQSPSPDELRLHPGALSVGETFAAVVEVRKDINPLVTFVHRGSAEAPWQTVVSYDSFWLPRIVGCLREAARVALPDKGPMPGQR